MAGNLKNKVEALVGLNSGERQDVALHTVGIKILHDKQLHQDRQVNQIEASGMDATSQLH